MSRLCLLPVPAHPPQVNFVKLTDSSGTKLSSLPSMWNRLCILDKSGGWLGSLLNLWSSGELPTGRWEGSCQAARRQRHRPSPHHLRSAPAVCTSCSSSYPCPLPPLRCPGTGTGFTLQLDTAFLYSSDVFPFQTSADADTSAPFPCVGALCGERPASAPPTQDLVPLFDGDEFMVQGETPADASTGFIMRLKVGWGGGVGAARQAQFRPWQLQAAVAPASPAFPFDPLPAPTLPACLQPNVSNEDLASICEELATDDAASRFNGVCGEGAQLVWA